MDLNAEQKRIATQEPKGHHLIKGVAGSGKTSVGLYRVHFLLNNYCYGKDVIQPGLEISKTSGNL